MLAALIDALPGPCAICRSWARAGLCDDCATRFAGSRPRCRRCAIALPADQPLCGACLSDPPPFEAAVTAVDYEPPWDALIARFKFRDGLDLAPVFARLLARAVRESGRGMPQRLLPAPLSDRRLRERGYNQAWELVRRVAGNLGVRADARLLRRTRDTPHQLTLPLDRRAANVRGAFAVDAACADGLRGAEVALVDDVLTTGATAAEMARTLLDAGAARVQLWVLARTPRQANR